MKPEFLRDGPFRLPNWRLKRVIQMITPPRPLRPRHYDDHPVRAYRRLLLLLIDAGDDEDKREAAFSENPEVGRAHLFHYARDLEPRQILEGRLLTTESYEQIAARFGTEPKVIEYYHDLFFHVRDRMQHESWIRKVIVGPRLTEPHIQHGSRRDEERGFALRLFGYFGGPLALDAAIHGIGSTKMPQGAAEVDDWFDDVLGQLVRTAGAAAASTLKVNTRNAMQTMKLALGAIAAAAKTPKEPPESELVRIVTKICAKVKMDLAERALPNQTPLVQKFMLSAVEPRAGEMLELGEGRLPETLERDLARMGKRQGYDA